MKETQGKTTDLRGNSSTGQTLLKLDYLQRWTVVTTPRPFQAFRLRHLRTDPSDGYNAWKLCHVFTWLCLGLMRCRHDIPKQLVMQLLVFVGFYCLLDGQLQLTRGIGHTSCVQGAVLQVRPGGMTDHCWKRNACSACSLLGVIRRFYFTIQ